MKHSRTLKLRIFQTALFAAALLLSSPLDGLIDGAMQNLTAGEKGDMETTFAVGANTTTILKG